MSEPATSAVLDDAARQSLIAAALRARENAYAPYSLFRVGAALLTVSGDVICGANVENASYGLTICAERAAVARAIAEGHRKFVALAIATDGGATPCGACRQVLAEFGDLTIFLVDAETGQLQREVRLADLLPEAFSPASLGERRVQ